MTQADDMESEGYIPLPASGDQAPLFATMIPMEMYQNIFQYAEKEDLVTLSCVARAFQHEAEHILYRSVDLTKGNWRNNIVSWCTAITNVERRAHRVHNLHFPPGLSPGSSPATTLEDSETHKLIARAFNAIINLKHLFFFGAGDYPVSLYPSTFKDCTFSLSSFAGEVSSFSPQNLIDFLIKHPDIEYWVPPQPFLLSITSFPEVMLPRLRELVLTHPMLTRAFKGRPIESLVLFFIHARHTRPIGQEAIFPLVSFEKTLHALEYIHGKLDDDWSTVDIINNLAEKIPNLKSLSFTSLGTDDSTLPANKQQSFVDAVSRLRHLETLSLNTDMDALSIPNDEPLDPSCPLETSTAWKGCSPSQSRKIAVQFMTACPSLKQLSFPKSRDADSDCLTYIRPKGDKRIIFDGFYRPNHSRWWMR